MIARILRAKTVTVRDPSPPTFGFPSKPLPLAQKHGYFPRFRWSMVLGGRDIWPTFLRPEASTSDGRKAYKRIS